MPKISLKPPFRITQGTLAQPLTDTEGRMMWAFMFRGGITGDQLAAIIWGHEAHWPLTYAKCVHVKLWQLRKKLEPFGWSISRGSRGASWGERAKRFLESLETEQSKKGIAQ